MARASTRFRPSATEQTLRTLTDLRLHAACSQLPAMTQEEWAAFLGDVAARGIQTPLEVTAQGEVLDGRHRLRAAAEIGVTEVPVRLIHTDDAGDYVYRAALRRRNLSKSQLAALAVEHDAYLADCAAARARSRANLRGGPDVATLPPRGRSRTNAALRFGVSERMVQDAAVVHEHDPGLFERLKAGSISAHAAARQVRRALRDADLPPAPPLPLGPFEVIYADPPWRSQVPDSDWAPGAHYPTMPLEEIAALEVPAADVACLFLWVPSALLPQGVEVMTAWGFDYVTSLVWVKPSIGLGCWVRHRHEPLLLGTRGLFSPSDEALRPDSVIEAPRSRHSEKPACVYELLERMYPRASKLELFARGKVRPGWAAWGNEVEAA